MAIEQPPSGPNYKPLIKFFDKASEKLKYPKFVCYTESEQVIRLQRAGSGSRHMGTLNITDNKAYGENTWFGRIRRDGSFELSRNRPYHINDTAWRESFQEIEILLAQFAADPPAFAAIQGKRWNNCCFCNAELTNPGSIHWGYGPICAGNYGLPWTDKEPESALTERVNNELEDAIQMQGLNFGKPKALIIEDHETSTVSPEDFREKQTITKADVGSLDSLFANKPKVPTGAEVDAHIFDAQKESHESFSVNFRETVTAGINNPSLRIELNALILREWETPDTLVDAIHDVTFQYVLAELEAIEG